MQRLRFWLICLLFATGIALNIERLDIGQTENVVNLASFVYLLAGMSVISTILIPSEWNIHTNSIVFFWIILYFLIKLFILNNSPLIGGFYTYLSITEIAVLIGLIVSTRKVMENLYGLEETVANITMADVSHKVKSLDAASADINKEFARSRRYNRPLGIVVIKLIPDDIQAHVENLSKDILRTMMSRYSMSNLIRTIDKEVRRPDLILEQHKENRIILLLPESNIDAVKAVSKNVFNISKDKVRSDISIGIAAFPDDALTFEDLVSFAENDMIKMIESKAHK